MTRSRAQRVPKLRSVDPPPVRCWPSNPSPARRRDTPVGRLGGDRGGCDWRREMAVWKVKLVSPSARSTITAPAIVTPRAEAIGAYRTTCRVSTGDQSRLPIARAALQEAAGIEEEDADSCQRARQPQAEDRHQQQPEPHPPQRDRAEQDHQGRRARHQPPGDAQGKQGPPPDLVPIARWWQMGVAVSMPVAVDVAWS